MKLGNAWVWFLVGAIAAWAGVPWFVVMPIAGGLLAVARNRGGDGEQLPPSWREVSTTVIDVDGRRTVR